MFWPSESSKPRLTNSSVRRCASSVVIRSRNAMSSMDGSKPSPSLAKHSRFTQHLNKSPDNRWTLGSSKMDGYRRSQYFIERYLPAIVYTFRYYFHGGNEVFS